MIEFVNVGVGTTQVPYDEGLALQRAARASVTAGERDATVILLEHPSVYTAGRRTDPTERPTDGTPVIDVDRGGKVTWHGPGQLVGYPIVRLAEPIDVVRYVRMLESVLIEVLADCGVAGYRVDGRSGVWVRQGLGDAKVAAIGIRVADGVTSHGFSLNCDNSLEAYRSIVACGIRDAGVTTISQVVGRRVGTAEIIESVERHLRRALEPEGEGEKPLLAASAQPAASTHPAGVAA